MVGRVLAKHGIVRKNGPDYELPGFNELSEPEVAELASLCEEKLNEFNSRRGEAAWSHRRKSEGAISGTVRYEALKRAKFRCEFCGISAELKALEVDHIEPRNRRGRDGIENYQALCCSCNAMKRDRDNTDFRGIDASYALREESWIFCELSSDRFQMHSCMCLAIKDGHPVTPGHTLIILRRHASDLI